MKTRFTLFALIFCTYSFGQSGRFNLDINLDGQELTKTVVKDYTSYQLIAGTWNHEGNILFWFAKMSGDTLLWSKYVPSHVNWAYMDIAPLDISKCTNSDDIIFLGRGSGTDGYTTRILKLDPDGELIWSREITADPNLYDQMNYHNNPMIMENDGFIFSMPGRDDLQVIKFDWDGDMAYSKLLHAEGNLFVANPGHLFIPNVGGGYLAGFECDGNAAIVKLNASFNVQWAHRIVIGEDAKLRSLMVTPNGQIFLAGKRFEEGGTFIGELDQTGTVESYYSFDDSEFYSIDQLFAYNGTKILANGRSTGYAIVDLIDGSYEEYNHNSAFCAFQQMNTTWSFGSHWAYDYYLDFDPEMPDCFDYTGPVSHPLVPISANDEGITCTVSNVGTLLPYTPQLTDLPTTLTNDCFLSVHEEALSHFTLYPNPVQSGAVLSFTTEGINATRVVLTDVQGKTVIETAFSQEILLPQLQSGVYFVTVLGENGAVATEKLVVE